MAYASQDWAPTSSDNDHFLSQMTTMSTYAQIPTSFYPQPQQPFQESPPISESSQKDDSDVDENEDEDSHHKRKKAGNGAQTDAGKKGKTTAKGKKEPAEKKVKEPKDETKLSKRKEQNRAAQRAFRERKEKHVKDLEDKVESLENKVEPLAKENETLKELLARLQRENVELKQAAFTFSLPKSDDLNPTPVQHKSHSPPTIFKDAPKVAGSPESFVSGSSTSRSTDKSSHSHSTSSSRDSTSESSMSSAGGFGLGGSGPKVESPPAVFSSEVFNEFTVPSSRDLVVPRVPVIDGVGTGVGREGGSHSHSGHHRPAQQARDSSSSTDSIPLQAYNQLSYPSYADSIQPSYDTQNPPYPTHFPAQQPQYKQTHQLQSQQQSLPRFDAPSPPSFAFSPTDFFPTSSAEAGPSSSNAYQSSNIYQNTTSNPSFDSFRDPSPAAYDDSFLNSMPSTGFDFDDPTLFNGSLDQFDFDSLDPSLAPFLPSSSILSPPSTVDQTQNAPSPLSWLASAASHSAAAAPQSPADLASKYRSLYQRSNDQKLPWWEESVQRGAVDCGQIRLGADPSKNNLQIPEVWEKITQSPHSSLLDDAALDVLCSEMKSKAKCNGSGPVMDPDEVQDLLDDLPHRFVCKKEAL